MPRKARIDAPGALQHIIIRGIERKRIFFDDRDRNDFLDRLGDILKDTSTLCYAWALIPNHVHLLLRTGKVPIATVMRRLLTGYAVSFNRRHNRHGQLFQNRYKSILCQEDLYFLQLVRYIHLNPFRSGLVGSYESLCFFRYSGHSVIVGKRKNDWQEVDDVLRYFGSMKGSSQRRYGSFVQDGIKEGRRPELVGGGLIRSIGGWEALKEAGIGKGRLKGDERILGESEFVLEVLKASEEAFERKYALKSKGYDLRSVAVRVGALFQIDPETVCSAGRYQERVKARSVFCYWAVRELGESATSLANKLKISQPAVSMSVRRGEEIVKDMGIELLPEE